MKFHIKEVTTKHSHVSGGDGDDAGVRQFFIDRFTGKPLHAKYLNRTQTTFEDDCVLAADVDDDGKWDGLTP